MIENGKIYIGLNDKNERVYVNLSNCNRHGLIAGASGTGKTITMKVLAESFSAAGVPVFVCDIKGDVSGIAEPGTDGEQIQQKIKKFGIENSFSYKAFPTVFYDIYSKGGHPVRVTVSDVGPSLLSQLMGLTEVQESVLTTVFRIADDKGLKIIDLKDLRAVITPPGIYGAVRNHLTSESWRHNTSYYSS